MRSILLRARQDPAYHQCAFQPQSGSVLGFGCWRLPNHPRLDARLYLRRVDLAEDAEVQPNENLERRRFQVPGLFLEIDPEEGDYAACSN